VKKFLEAYPKVLNFVWPAFLAKRFVAVAFHFDRTISQSGQGFWNSVVKYMAKARETPISRLEDVPPQPRRWSRIDLFVVPTRSFRLLYSCKPQCRAKVHIVY
jgi:hypothetical protein